jgi:hypothetical protein
VLRSPPSRCRSGKAMGRPFRVPFWVSSLSMVVASAWLLYAGRLLMQEFFSGHVFVYDYPYVWSPYVEPYSFKRAVLFRFTFSCVLVAVAVATITVARWLTPDLSDGRRTAFRSLCGLVALCPLTGMLVVSVMIGRLIINMGITPKRLLGFGCAAGTASMVVAFPRQITSVP